MSLRNTAPARNALLLSGIVVLGATLRFLHLGQKSYWWDEIVTIRLASLPFAAFGSALWQYEGHTCRFTTCLPEDGCTSATVKRGCARSLRAHCPAFDGHIAVVLRPAEG